MRTTALLITINAALRGFHAATSPEREIQELHLLVESIARAHCSAVPPELVRRCAGSIIFKIRSAPLRFEYREAFDFAAERKLADGENETFATAVAFCGLVMSLEDTLIRVEASQNDG